MILLVVWMVVAPAELPGEGVETGSSKSDGVENSGGFVEILPGSRIHASNLNVFFDHGKIMKRDVSDGCKADLSKCTDSDVNNFKAEDWHKGYSYNKEKKRLFFSSDGDDRVFIFSEDGRHVVRTYFNADSLDQQIATYNPKTKMYDILVEIERDLSFVERIDNNGAVYYTNGEVQVKDVIVPGEVYETYSNQIDYDSVADSGFLLTDGTENLGKVQTNYDKDSGVRTVTVSLNEDGSETTYYLPNGEELKESDGWISESNKLVNKEEKREIIFSENKQTEKNTGTGETTVTERREDGTTTVQQLDKDGKTESFELRSAEGRLLGKANVENGDLESFEFLDENGRTEGYCYVKSCFANPEGGNIAWTDGEKVCQGTKAQCYTNGRLNPTRSKNKEEACKTLTSSTCRAINDKENERSRHFEGGVWDFLRGRSAAQQYIGSILSVGRGWGAASQYFFPLEKSEWRKNAIEEFQANMLSDYITDELVCHYDAKKEVKKSGENAVFLSVGPGITQFVGTVSGEKSPYQGPVLCSEETPCLRGGCSEEGFCKQNGQIIQATFYKITWAVKAPAEEKFTPYKDENGVAITYNVQLRGERSVYLYNRDDATGENVLRLNNAASDKDAYVTYSPVNYDEVCVVFGKPPKDQTGKEVREFCSTFKPSQVGQVEWDESGRGTSAPSITTSDVNRAQI